MRIVAVKTIKTYLDKYPAATQSLLSWYEEAMVAAWDSPNMLKAHYTSASVITGKRVVFNIHGNAYRLIVDIEFRLKIVFIVWFGPHKEYDQLDAKTVNYDRTGKK